jgi:CHRD domain
MKKLLLAGCVVLLAAGAIVTAALAHNGNGNGKRSINAELEGFQEVPSISTNAEGEIKVKVNGSSIKYKLEYSGFERPAGQPPNEVLFAHIHFGQEGVNGGVAAFLCGGPSKPPCPQGSGTVTGTIVADDVQAIAAQGLEAKDIGALIRAMKAGYTYANVHSTEFGSGEIRGQIGDDDDDHGHRHHKGDRGKHKGNHDRDDD